MNNESTTKSSPLKTIGTSVFASLIVAAALNFFTFVTTISKMTTVIENIERRVVLLEAEVKESRADRRQLETHLARQSQLLEIIYKELQEVKIDHRRTFLPNNSNGNGRQ